MMIIQTSINVTMNGERERIVDKVVGCGGVARHESSLSPAAHFGEDGVSIVM